MSKRKQTDLGRDDGSYVAKKTGKFNIFAFILCMLIAFIIWLYASNVIEEKDKALSEVSSATQAAIVSTSVIVPSN